MGKIIIRGDFTLEGDIPALDKIIKRFKYAELETIQYPSVRLTQFEGIRDKSEENDGSEEEK